jgi:hypothetical protein
MEANREFTFRHIGDSATGKSKDQPLLWRICKIVNPKILRKEHTVEVSGKSLKRTISVLQVQKN